MNEEEYEKDLQVMQQYCLIDLEVSSIYDIEWNYFAQKHQEFLYSIEGKKIIKKKIFEGDFGKCPICDTPLIPFGRRNKPYITNLWLICPCTKQVVEEIPQIDSAIYGPWVDFEEPKPIWINDLRKNCDKHKAGKGELP